MGNRLPANACRDIQDQVKHSTQRMTCLFVLGEYDQVIADTSECRAAISLCELYAAADSDRSSLVALTPFVIQMQARAAAAQAVAAGRLVEALYHTNCGLDELLNHYCTHATLSTYDQSPEAQVLEQLRHDLEKQVFPHGRLHLRRALRLAVKEERFEDAARLRDELKDEVR